MSLDSRSTWVVSVFGSTRRKGPWRPRQRVRALAVFGSCHLDLRDIEGEEIEVSAFALSGDVRMVVSEDTAVELSGVAVFGDRRSVVSGQARPGGGSVRIKGFALFGDVDVTDSIVSS